MQKPPNKVLTHREFEVLQLVTEGLSTKEIAERLCVCERTILTHAYNVNSKLGTHGRAAMIRKAQILGLVDVSLGASPSCAALRVELGRAFLHLARAQALIDQLEAQA